MRHRSGIPCAAQRPSRREVCALAQRQGDRSGVIVGIASDSNYEGKDDATLSATKRGYGTAAYRYEGIVARGKRDVDAARGHDVILANKLNFECRVSILKNMRRRAVGEGDASCRSAVIVADDDGNGGVKPPCRREIAAPDKGNINCFISLNYSVLIDVHHHFRSGVSHIEGRRRDVADARG